MGDLQRDVKIRRRIESIYNKEQQSFPDLRSFGDYEEEKEDIIFNLCQGIDVADMEAKIAAYQKLHHEQILITEARKAENQRLKLESENRPEKEADNDTSAGPEESKDKEETAFQPSQSLQPSLPPPPAIVSQEQEGNTADTDPALSAASKAELVGIVSGWHPDMPRKRALQEAYSTIFVT